MRMSIAVSVLIVGACQSIEAHKIVETSTGQVKAIPVKGMPILVKRPTKAVFVATIRTFEVAGTATRDEATGRVIRQPGRTVTEVTITDKPILLGPVELFTLDLKRPAAGKIEYDLEFQDYYPTKISGKVEDKTISEIRQFAKDLLEKLAPSVTKQAGELQQKVLIKSEVKLVVFDLASGRVETVSNIN